jgi:acyl dehydratase
MASEPLRHGNKKYYTFSKVKAKIIDIIKMVIFIILPRESFFISFLSKYILMKMIYRLLGICYSDDNMLLTTAIYRRSFMADKSKVGMEFPAYTMTVEKNKIAEFAMAAALKKEKEEINPIYYDEASAKKAGYQGIPVPPTFLSSLLFWTGNGLPEIVKALSIDLSRLLHSKEEYEYYGNIYEGDTITRKMKVAEMYERGRRDRLGRFIDVTILETEVINQRGEFVAKIRTTMMER